MLYSKGVQHVARVPYVARGYIKSGTRALAIFYQHPTMQFFGSTQLIKKTLRCNFNYRYTV